MTIAMTSLSHSSVAGPLILNLGDLRLGHLRDEDFQLIFIEIRGEVASEFCVGSKDPISRITAGILDGSGGGPGKIGSSLLGPSGSFPFPWVSSIIQPESA